MDHLLACYLDWLCCLLVLPNEPTRCRHRGYSLCFYSCGCITSSVSGERGSTLYKNQLTCDNSIYYIRKGLVWFYDTKQKKEEANLLKLRQEQKGKLEELKKKTSYYSTQSLLERYDEVLAKKKEEAAKQEKMQQELRQRKPVSMPMRPNNNMNNNHMQRPFPPPQQQQQTLQPILPPPRTEPQWYDKIIDALVGDAGPETKFALICSHCFSHNGLVAKEEFDTIRK